MASRHERRALRSDSRRAGKSAGRRVTTDIERHILKLARDYAEDDLEAMEPRLEDPTFDATLAALERDIVAIADDYEGFKDWLITLAISKEVDAMAIEDDGVDTIATLFLVPIMGKDETIEPMARNEGFLRKLVKTFKACELAHHDAHVMLAPIPLDLATVSDIGPAGVRQLLDAFIAGFAHGEPTEASMEPLDRILTAMKVPEDGQEMCLLGLHVLVDEGWAGDLKIDYFDDFVVPDPSETPEGLQRLIAGDFDQEAPDALDDWLEATSEMAEGARIGPPGDFAKALSVIGINRLYEAVAAAKRRKHIPTNAPADGLHLNIAEDEILISYEYGTIAIGPIRIPSELWTRSDGRFETAARIMVSEGIDTTMHETPATMPQEDMR